MIQKIRLLDPILVVGVVVSVALALTLVLLGQDQISSLVIGLLTTAITLLIDLIARLRESEKRILQTTALGEHLANDQELFRMIHRIVCSYLALKEGEFELFVEKGKDALLECENILSSLERGYLLEETGSKFGYGRTTFAIARRTVKSVSYQSVEIWRRHLKSVLEANAEAVKRGIQVQRVFILNEDSLSCANDVLREQQEAGVQVFVVPSQEVPSTLLLESYMIVDDSILVTFYPTHDGRLREERISIIPAEVGEAISRYNRLLRRARAYE